MQLVVSTTRFESFIQLLTLLIVFALVLVLTFFATRFVGNYQKNRYANSNITVIETMKISATKYIQIIQIGGKYFAIAVCKDTVTLIGELSQEDLVFTDNTTEVKSESFKTVLDKFKKDKPED